MSLVLGAPARLLHVLVKVGVRSRVRCARELVDELAETTCSGAHASNARARWREGDAICIGCARRAPR